MTVQPIFEQTETRVKSAFTAQSIVECRAFSSADDVKNILTVTARAETLGCETLDGEVRYSGKVVYYLVWLDEENHLQKTEVGAEFSHKADCPGVTPTSAATVKIELQRTEVRPVNGSLMATSVAIAHVQAETVRPIAFLTGGEGLVAKTEQEKLLIPVSGETKMPIADEWEIPLAATDVLVPSVAIAVRAVGSGIGYVVCDGELCVYLLVVGEDGVPQAVHRTIPCRVECETAGAMPGMAASAAFDVQNVKVNAVVDSEKKTTALSIDAICHMQAEVVVENECTRAVDVYCPTCHLAVKREQIEVQVPAVVCSSEHRMTGKVGAEGVTAANAVVCSYPTGVSCAVTEVGDGWVTVEGVVSACAVLQGDTLFAVPVELPFSVRADADGAVCGDRAEASAIATSLSVRTVDDGEMEVGVELVATVCAARTATTSVISEVEVGEQKAVSTAAISVCYAAAGSTLWDVAKQLGVRPEQVASFNQDLQFPLTGEERIIVYRRLAD